MTKRMQVLTFRLIAIFASVAMLFSGAMASIAAANPMYVAQNQGQGNCGSFTYKDESAPFSHTAAEGTIITEVVVKAGSAESQGSDPCFPLTEDMPDDGCYEAVGLGTRSVTVSKIGEDTPDCKDISHVEFITQAQAPTATPTDEPSNEPTSTPTDQPSDDPSDEPTTQPSDEPTSSPSDEPTTQPSDEPTSSPSNEPTTVPSDEPTTQPSDEPTTVPSDEPTTQPSDEPTTVPSEQPTSSPSNEPTTVPSEQPTNSPSEQPSGAPTSTPTIEVTVPTALPSDNDGGSSGTPSQSSPVANVPGQASQAPAAPIVAGVSDEDESDAVTTPERRQAVAGVSDADEEARPQAVLAATGIADASVWLILTFAMMLMSIGAAIRAWQLNRK